MKATTTTAVTQAAVSADTTAIASKPRFGLSRQEQTAGRACQPGPSAEMSEAMRTIVWITGVAFGVLLPGALAQGAVDPDDTQKVRMLQMPITDNHDTDRLDIAPMNRGRE